MVPNQEGQTGQVCTLESPRERTVQGDGPGRTRRWHDRLGDFRTHAGIWVHVAKSSFAEALARTGSRRHRCRWPLGRATATGRRPKRPTPAGTASRAHDRVTHSDRCGSSGTPHPGKARYCPRPAIPRGRAGALRHRSVKRLQPPRPGIPGQLPTERLHHCRLDRPRIDHGRLATLGQTTPCTAASATEIVLMTCTNSLARPIQTTRPTPRSRCANH
jgi:hypothetical protein